MMLAALRMVDQWFYIILSLLIYATYGDRLSACPNVVQVSTQFTAVFRDYCYIFVSDEMYWTEAKRDCKRLGGRLLEIHNEDEMAFISARLRSSSLGWDKNGVWLGASDRDKDGHWHWTSGKRLGYSNWDSGSPSASILFGSLENCAVMWRASDWRWDDKRCEEMSFHYNFICQFDRGRARNMIKPKVQVTQPTSHTQVTHAVTVHTDKEGSGDTAGDGDRDYGGGELSRDTIIAIVVGLIALVILSVFICFLYVYCRRRYKPPPPYMEEPPLFDEMTCDQLRRADAYPLRPPSYTPPDNGHIYTPTDVVVENRFNDVRDRRDDAGYVLPDHIPPKCDNSTIENVYENDTDSLPEGACGGSDDFRNDVKYVAHDPRPPVYTQIPDSDVIKTRAPQLYTNIPSDSDVIKTRPPPLYTNISSDSDEPVPYATSTTLPDSTANQNKKDNEIHDALNDNMINDNAIKYENINDSIKNTQDDNTMRGNNEMPNNDKIPTARPDVDTSCDESSVGSESTALLHPKSKPNAIVNNLYQPDVTFKAQRSTSDDAEHIYEDIEQMERL